MTKLDKKEICIYLQIHQPYRINPLEDQQISHWSDLFQGLEKGKQGLDMTNKGIFEKVARSCYIPTTVFWLQQCKLYPNLQLTLSFSGTFLEQCLEFKEYGSQVLDLFRQLLATGQVEILDETYYHSLSFLVDLEEYLRQIKMHRDMVKQIFDYEPTSFRNTELIYNNQIGGIIQNLGYKSILIEDVATVKQSNHKILFANTQIQFSPPELDLFEQYKIGLPHDSLILIPRDSRPSDGIIFLSNESTRLQDAVVQDGKDLTCIFTDYEFLGEHNLENSPDIYGALSRQLGFLVKYGYQFTTPSAIASSTNSQDLELYDSPNYSSWAHKEKDISVWLGGIEQDAAFEKLRSLYKKVQNQDNPELLQAWRKLSTSCHFYFLGRKTGTDGDFVDLFSPFESVDAAFENYMQVAYIIEKMAKDTTQK
jgi:alpha-amylase